MSSTADKYYRGAPAAASPARTIERQQVREALTKDSNGVVLVMVGLPARGKSFISRKIENFVRWRGMETRVFNVGRYRRGLAAPEESGRSDFFDESNQIAKAARETAAQEALTDALTYLDAGGKIAIFDATNSSATRRTTIRDRVHQHNAAYSVLFVEVICNDKCVVEANMLNKVLHSPDFEGMGTEEALADLRARIAKYESVYETVHDDEGAYIKLFDLSSKVMAHHCYGRISKSVIPFLMGIHIGSRPIWLVRAGAGEANPQSPATSDRLKRLSTVGHKFARSLAAFVEQRTREYWDNAGKPAEPTHVFTSTMPRAIGSVSSTLAYEESSALNPIDKGTIGYGWWDVEIDGDVPPWSKLQVRHPEFWPQFRKDPLRCRFPGGECYMDVVRRLEGLLIEMEMSTKPLLIVSHITTLQVLLSYLRGLPVEDAWLLQVPKGAVFEAIPSLGGSFVVQEHKLVQVESPEPSEMNDAVGGNDLSIAKFIEGEEISIEMKETKHTEEIQASMLPAGTDVARSSQTGIVA